MTSPDAGAALPAADEVARLVSRLRASSATFNALLQRYGQVSPALRHHGLIQWTAGEIGDAVESFRAALRLTPDDADLWRDLAGTEDAAGRPAEALTAVGMALHHRPDDARSWLLCAGLRDRAGAQGEAEAAFRRAIALDPGLGDAHFGLGLIHFSRRRMDEAVASFRAAVEAGHADALGFTALGHALYLAGGFADSASAFERAGRCAPLDIGARRRHARALTYARMIEGDPGRAMAGYAELAGADAEDPALVLRDAFSVLSGFGHPEAATAVGRLRLAQDPDDAVQRYLLGAVSGEALTRAPVDYVERHFDGFAETFDEKLVEVLHYRAPEDMARLIAGTGRGFDDLLDLGCGTGLAAAHLARFGGRLTGVDLSRGMLDEAAKRGVYAELVKAEAIDFLRLHPAGFDLVFAADVLIYFGDLAPFVEGAARAVRAGGLLVLSAETAEVEAFRLLPSGRFAHSAAYIERLAERHFTVLAREATTLRLEAARPAAGLFLVLERRA